MIIVPIGLGFFETLVGSFAQVFSAFFMIAGDVVDYIMKHPLALISLCLVFVFGIIGFFRKYINIYILHIKKDTE